MGRARPQRRVGAVQEVRAQRDEHPAEVQTPDRVGRGRGGQVPVLHKIPHGRGGAVRRHGNGTPGDGVHDVARGILQQLPPRSTVSAGEVRRGTESYRQELPGCGRGRKAESPGSQLISPFSESRIKNQRNLREFHRSKRADGAKTRQALSHPRALLACRGCQAAK